MENKKKPLVTKKELEEVLKEVQPSFKHIEPHVILIIYTYIKKKLRRGGHSLTPSSRF